MPFTRLTLVPQTLYSTRTKSTTTLNGEIELMSNTTQNALSMYVERARKVLQHEQRTNHQDQAIKPGGLELFVSRWAEETSAACKQAGLDLRPIHHFAEHLEGYRRQDPMQRAASLRAALAILHELENDANGQSSPATSTRGSEPAQRTTVPPVAKNTANTAQAQPSAKLTPPKRALTENHL